MKFFSLLLCAICMTATFAFAQEKPKAIKAGGGVIFKK